MSNYKIPGFTIASMSELDDLHRRCNSAVIDDYAWASAASSLIPIPCVDVAADATVIYNMFDSIRSHYSLNSVNNWDIGFNLKMDEKVLLPVVKRVFDYVTKEGIMKLIIQYAPKYAGKNFTKYIPIIGQGISAYAGYQMASYLGEEYSGDCYKLCKLILER